MKDTAVRYGSVSRFFHWAMFLCFIVMFVTAIMWNQDEKWFSLMPIHKSVGFLLLVLVALRFVWALMNRANRPESGVLAKLGHLALYALMFAVPIIGMIRQYGGGRGPLNVFGVEVMKGSPEKIEWMVELGNNAHGKLAFFLLFLALGHIAMAVVHQLKGEKLLQRMIGK